jgi:hypothetical protein
VVELLDHGLMEVGERGVVQPVEVEEEVVEVDPLGAVRGARRMGGVADRADGLRGDGREGRRVVFPGRPVQGAAGRPDERRVDASDRVVVLRGNWRSVVPGLERDVRVGGSGRVLVVRERAAPDLLHDVAETPAVPPSSGTVERGDRLRGHGLTTPDPPS